MGSLVFPLTPMLFTEGIVVSIAIGGSMKTFKNLILSGVFFGLALAVILTIQFVGPLAMILEGFVVCMLVALGLKHLINAVLKEE
jgi:hypothetical protein